MSDSNKVRRRLVAVGEHFLLVLKRANWRSMGLSSAMNVVHKGHLFKLQQFGVFHSKVATGAPSPPLVFVCFLGVARCGRARYKPVGCTHGQSYSLLYHGPTLWHSAKLVSPGVVARL